MRTSVLPIVFGHLGAGWEQYPGRQTLMYALAEHTPVVLLRRRRADERRFARPTVVEVRPNIFEVRNAFALRSTRIGRRMGPAGGWLDGRWLRGALRSVGIDDFVYWLTDPVPEMLWGMPRERLIYDCVDPCFLPEFQAKFDRAEAFIGRRARLIFCTAHSLLERMRRVNDRAFLLPNACSPDTYEAAKSDLPVPSPLRGRTAPFIGYMGTLDWRFDAETVAGAARLLPNYTFVLVGRVNADQEARVAPLRAMKNVVVTGSASYDEGLAYTRAFDVGLIPFIAGEMNDAINAVKMYMYLAAGKPVVSTWIRECRMNSEFVAATRTPAEFAQAIEHALQTDDETKRAARMAFGLRNRWQDRALQALELMREHGIMPRDAAVGAERARS